MNKLPYLNLGCGVTFDERWMNVDFVSTAPDVMAHNLLTGIPFGNDSFEVVYHSHVLEHFPKDKAKDFLCECFRVLKPGGILRIAIPDLEQIARNYINHLEDALNGIPGAKEKYEWTVIELLDQMVRNKVGGEMLKYVADESKKNDAYLLERCGHEIVRLLDVARGKNETAKSPVPPKKLPVATRIRNRVRRKLTERLLGDEYQLLLQARFRNSGEIHQWMYDRYSLAELVKECGFKNSTPRSAFESSIPGWENYRLDGNNGLVRKPDSLFMEAVK
jgi:predicted SAM-dependent methyltransferase